MYQDSLLKIDAATKYKFNVHPPPNETAEEKTQRHNENGARFLEWAEHNPCILQVSYPRSGRHWLASILHLLTGKLSVMPYEINSDNYNDFDVFTTHGYTFDYMQLLEKNPEIKIILPVRDPRDCALSNAYRSSILGIPDFGYSVMCTEIVEKATEHAALYWEDTFNRFANQNHIVIQYEHLCLYPFAVMRRLLRYIGLASILSEPLEQAIKQADQIKFRGNKTLERIASYTYANDLERYQQSCLKWQQDKYWLPQFTDLLYQQSGELMEKFGYTREGQRILA